MGPFDVAWLAASVRLSTPLLFAATGELVAERSGILNIGLEGMMLSGAFFAYLVGYLTDSLLLGLLAGVGAGALIAIPMALLSINARADQIVIGVGLNLLALGVTTFIFREVFAGQPEAHLARPETIALPILSRIPVIGSALFDQTLLVYLALVGVAVVWFVLQRTHAGLAIRAAGEVPAAADTAGVRVEGVRWAGTLVAGSMAGLAGAFLSVGQLGFFIEGMSAGRGFLALAAVIFGGWRALGVLGACLVFGAADALQLRLQAEETVPPEVWLVLAIVTVAYLLLTARRRRGQGRRGLLGLVCGLAVAALGLALFALAPAWHFPSQLWLSQPYVLALIALAGFEGRARMPSAIAVPYRRGGED